ncbi:hypothetical protein HELRODRAFT_161504 [Helobdella robusta]|uniref:DDE-1 domain-containing protein n=1 Tax=Helobdella robusta TaxID=6412 RepID=T1ERK4_HELRO|nr:hypothetical protein HELRODRAFT_161504 [Helobdella robusta]ESO02258.1 hypothetical protein HELRODRAFT_161504 [Helobdella robusta]
MPRTHIRKTERGKYSLEIVRKAVLIVKNGEGLRKVAKQFEIDKTTSSRYVKRFANNENSPMIGFWGNRRVFTFEEELIFCNYLITSFQGAIKVLSPKGQKQVGAIKGSEDRGKLVTLRCSIQTPVLLLLDNHESHLSIEAIDYAMNNGIVMLSFPPHCSHKLQPLDRTVYGPFKRYYNTALKDFMINNTAHRPDIYDIPGLVVKAYKSAMTIENITSSFKVTGIWPHNSDVFAEEEFLPSKVTDRFNGAPDETLTDCEAVNPNSLNNLESTDQVFSQQDSAYKPSESSNPQLNYTIETCKNVLDEIATIFKPENVRPFPVAPPRKLKGKHPRPGKTRILTDTPIKNEISQRQEKRRQKTEKK